MEALADRYQDDPRPDLAEDSAQWTQLLTTATGPARGALHALRCGGTILVWQPEKGRWELRPVVNAHNWSSLLVYSEFKARWLMPIAAQVTELLRQLPAPAGPAS